MPPVIGAVLSGVVAASTGITVFGVTLTGFAAGAAVFAASLALTVLQGAFSKPKTPNLDGFKAKASGQTQQFKQAITARRIVYGEVRVSGPLLFVSTSDSKNQYLHLVIALAAHEVQEIGEVWFDAVSIPNDALDGSGNVTSGPYKNRARIRKFLGTSGQTADSFLAAETEWSSTDRLQGIAGLYVRLEFDREVYPNGIPNISAWVKGKKILDPRDGVTRYSPNVMLLARDYLTDAALGIGADGADVSADSIIAGANLCDEIVEAADVTATISAVDAGTNLITLSGETGPLQTGDRVVLQTTATAPGGLTAGGEYYWIAYQRAGTVRGKLASSLANAIAGTPIDITSAGTGTRSLRKTGEPRYHGGGTLDTDAETGANLRDIVSAMGGEVYNTGGLWVLKAASYATPAITLDENHLRAPIRVQTKVTRAERFNAVKGVYVSPLNAGQPSDYPAVTNSTYAAADGRQILTDLDQPMTQRAGTAQRLAKIHLERHRQELVVEYPCNLQGLLLKAGDTVMVDYSRWGWSGKVFEVRGWKLVFEEIDGVPVPGVDLMLQETAAAVYDWNNGEETVVDPAPNTSLPNPFGVTVLVGFSLDSIPVPTQAGDRTYKIRASWDLHEDAFVRQNGTIEIQTRLSGAADWTDAAPVDGSATSTDLFQAALDLVYEVRARPVNNLGVPGAWTTITGFVVGSSLITDTEDWENETLASQDWESGSLSSEDWET